MDGEEVEKRRRRSYPRRTKRNDEVLFCAVDCKYEVVTSAAADAGWRVVCRAEGPVDDGDLEDTCNVYWVDVASIADRLAKMKPWQRVNHFPGMNNIARKNRLAQNLEKMRRAFPKAYGFYPRTWVLPLELGDFRMQFDSRGKSTRFYIVKPDSGCQGRGIFLTQCFESISPFEQVVAQHYIKRPLLIDGFKFDLRLYVLVTSCAPLRIYLFHDGLVRFCTEEYTKPTAENVAVRCMHLTNYAINKHSDNFHHSDGAVDVGSKRSVKWFMDFVAADKGTARAKALWRRMGAMCVKSIVSILPTLAREYEAVFFKDSHKTPVQGSRCFEILGVDVIIDHALKPWLVEVNHLPSFATDSALDTDVKSRLIEQTLAVVRAKAADRHAHDAAQRARAEERLYSTPAPPDDAVSRYRRRVEDLFRKYDPDKLVKVDALMNKFIGKEARLCKLVESKYVEDENSTDDANSDDDDDVDETGEQASDDDHTDSDVEREDETLVDFDRIYPIPRSRDKPHANMPSYAAQIKHVFDVDEKRLKRFSCPLRQPRASEPQLPPLAEPPADDGRVPWGDPFRRPPSKPASLPEHKPLPMPGAKQVAAADRLARGFSSSRARSASASTDRDAVHVALDHYAGKVASVVAHAKEWRRKLDDANTKRNVAQVALQPKTFMFTDHQGGALFEPPIVEPRRASVGSHRHRATVPASSAAFVARSFAAHASSLPS